MGIVDEDIERVRAASDLVAIASEHLALRRVGRRHVGLCPFHAEKTPSFSINAEEGLFYCFGCQAKGDVITFVREVQHLDFVGAVESLAGRSGITLRYDNQRESGERHRRTKLVEAMGVAVEWYHERLLTAPDAAHARGYLRSRGYDGDTVRRFKLGWAPEGWDTLCRALRLPDDVLRDTGLGFRNKANRMQDSFRARVLFPIFDPRGDAVAIGGRVLPGGDGPKYKNSPQTAIYDKSQVLYGLNWAKGDIVTEREVIVCEGYTDVIGFATAGLGRAVATCGTALTDRHFATLANFAGDGRIVLAFDADAAGQGAAERFYEWERRYKLDVYVAAVPAGSDPGELAARDPAALRAAVTGAMPFLAFRLERVLAAAKMGTAEGRARAAETAVAIIAEHPSDLVRDQYVMQVADRCRVTPERLRSMLAGDRTAPRRPRDGAPAPAASGRQRREGPQGPEIMALRLAVHRPTEVSEHLHEALFHDEVAVACYRALAGADTLPDAIGAAEPQAAEVLARLAVEEEDDVETLDVVARLVDEAAQRAYHELLEEIRADYDVERAQLADWIKRRMGEIAPPHPDVGAIDQLVAWLAARFEERA